ncbi:hypothetical protein [Histidinibacterium lentulum]|uniref:DUF1837 domain-containing protein n=1 Tax=Histidinibacterium lentulum TaxID=2480588 RepID=A0A3N2QEP2_9RHOB|nr:hypothetical protein [Histidinibacterium lentulum]ROT93663.1 hypothetical protein EAT49_20690 [Histidinibacterium lentulum]
MIQFEKISNGKFWAGTNWTVTDEDSLASLIARVALGQARHVEKILKETNVISPSLIPSAAVGAKKLLTATNPAKPWHRDGWLFQVIAWIAAHLQDAEALKAPPHMIHAHKGFDGIQVRLDHAGGAEMVVICEQKATTGPRGKITSEVWPEFREIEKGTRDNELIAEVTTLLEKSWHPDADAVVEKILWGNARAYSVAVTVGDDEHSEEGRKKLFKGYKKIVDRSHVKFRQADTFYKVPMRDWMANIVDNALQIIDEWEAENV